MSSLTVKLHKLRNKLTPKKELKTHEASEPLPDLITMKKQNAPEQPPAIVDSKGLTIYEWF